jgi:putative ABC transport system permease protein
MWMVALRDLQMRRRRFLIGVLATALVFSITLLLSGISAALRNETTRTVDSFNVDAWIVPTGVGGPFTSWRTIPAATAAQVAAEPGVHAAAPLVLFRQTTPAPHERDVNVIGYEPGKLGDPPIAAGRAVQRDGEIVVDRALDARLGSTIEFGGHGFRVVGLTHGLTYFAGIPASFMTLHDAQQLIYGGAPFATTIVTRGYPSQLPTGLVATSNAQARADLSRPVRLASSTNAFLNTLLWLIAAGIIGAILYMSALERVRDFAVMKATGASSRFVVVALGAQAVILALMSAVLALAIALLLKGSVPMAVEIPTTAYQGLFIVALVVGIVASLAGLRRAVSVDPALAFGA